MEAITAYDQTLASREFQFLENIRLDTKRNETSALNHVRRERDEHWEGVVAEKEVALAQEKAENVAALAQEKAEKAALAQELAKLKSQLATK